MDEEYVTIGRDDHRLSLARAEVSGKSVWSLAATLEADGLTASTMFWLGPEGAEDGLDWFFGWLASDWRGWEGARVWDGMEGGLTLTCVHSGRVEIGVVLRHLSGADWTATATLVVDPGEQMTTVARELQRLLAP